MSETTQTDILYLPDTMADWPWPRAINPLHEEVKAESDAWFKSFKPFTRESQLAFDKCDTGLLASLAYPFASREHLRTGCDLMNLIFVVDEYTDVESAPVVREMVDVMIDALNNPLTPRPKGEILLGEIARQFWERATLTATPTSQRHFIEGFTDYLESVVEQALDRNNDSIRTVKSYFKTRRENIGARPSYVPAELGLHIPDEAFYHPVITELSYHIADLIIIDNDIASYNKEQATGDDRYNILTVAMHQFGFGLQEAMEWATKLHAEIKTKFLDGLKRVPSFGPTIDKSLEDYIQGLALWPRSIVCWNFESGRYFGSKGLEIQKSRCVPLLPKVAKDSGLRREQVVVPLVSL